MPTEYENETPEVWAPLSDILVAAMHALGCDAVSSKGGPDGYMTFRGYWRPDPMRPPRPFRVRMTSTREGASPNISAREFCQKYKLDADAFNHLRELLIDAQYDGIGIGKVIASKEADHAG